MIVLQMVYGKLKNDILFRLEKNFLGGGDDVQSFENIGKTNDLFPTRLRSAVGWRFDVDRSGIRRTNSSG